MWSTWVVIGLSQIYLNRYMKDNWRWNKLLHAILGMFAMALTITAAMLAMQTGGWVLTGSALPLHSKVGFSAFVLGILLMVGGMTANIFRLKVRMDWRTKYIRLVGKIHKYFGWLVLLFTQFVISTGIYKFYDFVEKDTKAWILVGCSCSLFFVLLLIGEIRHQLMLRKEVAFVVPDSNMTRQEFNEEIAKGTRLVLIDDIVLDVGDFVDQHPGGRFLISHNIGRDISKFFYGGYSLEDNLSGSGPAQGHAHSTYARKIVNNLAIARYQPEIEVNTTSCRVRNDLCSQVNRDVKTIVLESVEKKGNVTNFKSYFNNWEYLGQHFLVRSGTGISSITRHYTICNAMRPDIYQAYISALKHPSSPDYKELNPALVKNNQDSK